LSRQEPATSEASREHIRGSALLLSGRVISLGLNFVTQVLIVRHLSKLEFGALSYALALVQAAAGLNLFGYHKTIHRFLPIYEERGEYGKIFGALALSVGTILGLGLAAIALVHVSADSLAGLLNAEPATIRVLTVLVVLLPVEALDLLLVQLLAVFAGARSIFFRRHVVGPALRLAAVVAVTAGGGDVFQLAYAYLGASALGVAIYVVVLVRVLRKRSLLSQFSLRGIEVPARELFRFNLPLLSSDVLVSARGSLVVFLLEYFHPSSSVAEYRAVVPAARLNTLVQANFAPLFVPLMARLFHRGDRDGIATMHRQGSLWVMVLSFPVLAATVAFAEPVTVRLFGERYAGSAHILSLLAVGNFVHAAFAFNVETLKVYGKVRSIVLGDVITTGIAIALGFGLIPALGATGAALTVAGTLVAHAAVNQVLLRRATGIAGLDGTTARILVGIALATAALTGVQRIVGPPLVLGLAATAAVALALLRISARRLAVETVFPEIVRVPWLAWLLRRSSAR
jgi:O-antigen/teichoic acid export membrane protein